MDDGNNILISFGQTDIKVIQLGFFKMPKKTIHTFSNEFTANLVREIGYDMSKDVVLVLAEELVRVRNLDEVKRICLQLEADKRHV